MHAVFQREQQHLLGLALWTFCPHPSQQVGFPIAVHVTASEKSKERCQGQNIKRRVRIVMNTSLNFHVPFQYLITLFMVHHAQVFGTRYDEIYGSMGALLMMIINKQKQTHPVQRRRNKLRLTCGMIRFKMYHGVC